MQYKEPEGGMHFEVCPLPFPEGGAFFALGKKLQQPWFLSSTLTKNVVKYSREREVSPLHTFKSNLRKNCKKGA